MQRYYALLTDGTLRDIGLHPSWEAANEVEPQNTIWLINDEDAEQWRSELTKAAAPQISMCVEGERPAFRELRPTTCPNTLNFGSPPPLMEEALIDAIAIKEAPANPVSMGVGASTMTLLPNTEKAEPSKWRVYLRGSNLQFTFGLLFEALHPAVAVEECRAQHAAGGLIKDSREYLAIRHHSNEAMRTYLISYDAAPEAMGQGREVDAHTAAEACKIARWVFLIPEALSITTRRLDR